MTQFSWEIAHRAANRARNPTGLFGLALSGAPCESRRVKRTSISLALIILLVLAIRIPLLAIPFERDGGGHAHIAGRMGCA